MGTWGAGVLEDDFARDVYDAYLQTVGGGLAPVAAVAAVRARFARELSDPEEEAVAWLALARAQREVGSVDPALVARVKAIVGQGLGLERWREAGAAPLRQRKAALARFLRDLAKPARPARPKVAAPAAVPFDVGDCLVFDCADGRVGGAVVTRRKVSPSTTSHILTAATVPAGEDPAPPHFTPPRWRTVHAERPDLAVKFEVYDTGWARHRHRYRLVCRVDPGEVPAPLTLKLATWGTLWRIFPA